MPNGELSDDPGRELLLELERVRLRRNVYVAERALLLAGALAAGATALLLPAALRAGAILLAALVAGVVVAGVVLVAIVIRDLWRDWLTAAGAAAWADDHGQLDGRLTTLHAAHDSHAARSLLFPVLVAQVRARLDAWAPARLVPNLVPPGPLATLLGAAGALVVVLLLTPDMLPDAPREAVHHDEPALTERIETAARTPETAKEPTPADELEHETDGVVSWIASAQDRLREATWGADGDRVREALARAEAARHEREASGGASVLPFARTAAADRTGPTPTGPTGAGARGTGATSRAQPSSPAEAGVGRESSDAVQAGRSGGGSGAGGERDDELLAPAPADVHPTGDAFTLAIAARVRARGGRPRPPTGDAPPLEPDARPALARQQRPTTPFHRMPVPPEYTALVRRLYVRPVPPPPEVP